MKPGRIYYSVDLTEEAMRQILPYIDTDTDLLVIGGYGDLGREIRDRCPRCGIILHNQGYVFEDVPEYSGRSRARCPRCMAPVDDAWDYVGCEDMAEAFMHVFHGGGYPAYQIWPKDAARRDDVVEKQCSMHHGEWLYRDVDELFMLQRKGLMSDAMTPEFSDLLAECEAYSMEELAAELAEVIAEASDE